MNKRSSKSRFGVSPFFPLSFGHKHSCLWIVNIVLPCKKGQQKRNFFFFFPEVPFFHEYALEWIPFQSALEDLKSCGWYLLCNLQLTEWFLFHFGFWLILCISDIIHEPQKTENNDSVDFGSRADVSRTS